jgi:hypothetical protein
VALLGSAAGLGTALLALRPRCCFGALAEHEPHASEKAPLVPPPAGVLDRPHESAVSLVSGGQAHTKRRVVAEVAEVFRLASFEPPQNHRHCAAPADYSCST